MTDLIEVVQKQEPGSELVELIELELDDNTTLYFHAGLDLNLDKIKFRDKLPISGVYTEREYVAIPIELTGIERSADGASARPSLTVANILTTFRTELEPFTNKDLVGKRVIRRTTLKKYLVGESDDTENAGPPIEFPTDKFIIDRIAGENKIQLNLELAAVTDLEGVKLPSRIVIGKYCNWEYQGVYAFDRVRGGCTWDPNSMRKWRGGTAYNAYFNIDNEPIVSQADQITYIGTLWAIGQEYGPDNWVYTVPATGFKDFWRSNATTTGSEPTNANVNWQRIRTYTDWATATDYEYKEVINGVEDPNYLHRYVEYDDGNQITTWRLIKSHTSSANIVPEAGSSYWARGDLCGKLLDSCKCRFQFQPEESNSTKFPSYQKGNDLLPFGGFPGSEKYR